MKLISCLQLYQQKEERNSCAPTPEIMLLIEDHYNVRNIQITSQQVLINRVLMELIEV